MGSCISTGRKTDDGNPNLYRVVNIDDNGLPLWNGELGISRTEITLYRKGLSPTRWPLRCLRRYGYDTDLFSFEVGRRCVTGEGIYAFRCRYAEHLFQTLQSFIQMSTIGDDGHGTNASNTNSLTARDASSPMSTLSGPNSLPNNNMIGMYILPNPRPSNAVRLSPSVTSDEQHRNSYDGFESNYLEPVTGSNSITLSRLNSIGNGTISTMSIEQPMSPGSPNSLNNILEVTTLNPLPSSGLNNNGVSNIYQEFHLRGTAKDNSDPRNMKKLSLDIPPQEYAPTVNSTTPTEASSSQIQNSVNGNRTKSVEHLSFIHPISPTQSAGDRLDTPTYMNITPGELSSAASTPKVFGNDFKQIQIIRNNNYLVDPTHCYENLEPSELRPFLRQQHRRLSRTELITKIDTVASSPIDLMGKGSEPTTPNHGKVNYIVLDLDHSHSQTTNSTPNTTTPSTSLEMAPSNSSNNTSPIKNIQHTIGQVITTISSSISTSTTTHSVSSLLLPPESPQKGAFDYVTIDFHKTNALSNSIVTTTECEGLRKTRHSATGTDCWPPT